MRTFSFVSVVTFVGGVILAACANADIPPDEDSGVTVPKEGGAGCTVVSQKKCGAACVDTTKDPNNCGNCGVKCAANQFCAASKCNDACNNPLKLCGQFCVDIQSDHENCGKCGMGCAADRECKMGMCIKKCPTGLTVCDPDCVDTTSDPNNCGSCSNACAMTETCIGGTCCGTGQILCNGVCTNTQYDNNNCGACGFSCGSPTPYCANGKCRDCNPTALILMDTNQGNQTFINAVTSAGIQNTYISNGALNYNGTPTPQGFGTVVLMSGSLFQDMNAQGQTAIINAHNNNVGLVIDEWALYLKSLNYYNTLSQAFILSFGSYNNYTNHTLQMMQNHPIWQNLPNSWSTSFITYGISGSIINGGTQIAQCTNCNNTTSGVFVRDVQGNTGRRVYISTPFNYTSTTWSSDTNVVTLMINSIRWATGCN
jgi:hypothetical protein